MNIEERIKFIEHKGKRILFIDMSELLEDYVISVIENAEKIIRMQPEKSVLTLTDVTHARYNSKVVSRMQEYVKGNKPYVKAAAIIGINPIKRIIFNKIMEFSQRELFAFEDKEKAMDWLAKQ